jgi:N-acetylglucosamine kinase-like BadF-type ATPase
MEKEYYFGIDGGGTHSRIAICDKHMNIVYQGIGESTNIYSVSIIDVKKNLKELIEQAMKESHVTTFFGGCIGSAGLARTKEKKLFQDYFSSLLPNTPVHLCNDGEILLVGALMEKQGYAIISGTGSLALARTALGMVYRSGGYGYMLSDEGSAWWIGDQAIKRTLRSFDTRDLKTDMAKDLLQACNLSMIDDFIEYVHHKSTKADIAKLAPIVTEYAKKKDLLAHDILQKGAYELFLLVKSVQHEEITNNKLVLAGGVFEHDTIVTNEFTHLIKTHLPHIKIVP